MTAENVWWEVVRYSKTLALFRFKCDAIAYATLSCLPQGEVYIFLGGVRGERLGEPEPLPDAGDLARENHMHRT